MAEMSGRPVFIGRILIWQQYGNTSVPKLLKQRGFFHNLVKINSTFYCTFFIYNTNFFLIKSNLFQIKLFRLIWEQKEFRLVSNQ